MGKVLQVGVRARAGLIGLACLCTAGPVWAQGLAVGPAVASRGSQSGVQEVRIAVDRPLGSAPALSGFRLHFGGTDHKIRRMMVMPDGTAFRAALNDRGGEDRFSATARWWVIPGAVGGTVSGDVRGVSTFEIPPGPPGTTLVLGGFDLQRPAGSDANVRTFAIQLDGASRQIRTVLLDDQGGDFTAMAEAIAVGFAFSVVGGPIGASLATTLQGEATGHSALSQARISLDANTRLRSYSATIAYAWVPDRYVDAVRELSGDQRARSAASGVPPGDSRYLLTGFSFHFGNSDHHLGDVGVHLEGIGLARHDPRTQRITLPETIISWQDSNQDDPIQWSVRYLPLRPDPPRIVPLAPVRPLVPSVPQSPRNR